MGRRWVSAATWPELFQHLPSQAPVAYVYCEGRWGHAVPYVMEPLTQCLLTDLGPVGLLALASSDSKILEL